MQRLLGHIAGFLLIALFVSACSPTDSLPDGATGRIVKVIDGDTVDISIDGTVERIRLIGIDTPETKKPNTPIQCYGLQASGHTEELLPKGTIVTLQRDVEARDVYHRLLGYIFRFDDGLFINRELIVGGFARPLSIEPNTTYTEEFLALANNAQTQGVGLWAAC